MAEAVATPRLSLVESELAPDFERSGIIEAAIDPTPNKPAAPNAGIPSPLTLGHHCPGVGDSERSEYAPGTGNPGLGVHDNAHREKEVCTYTNAILGIWIE